MSFFEDVSIINRAYCDSLGLPSDVYQRPLSKLEADGVPLSADEIEIADLMAKGINRRGAEMFVSLFHLPPTQAIAGPKQRTFHAVIEYPTRRSMWDQQRIEPSEYTHGNWTGD